MPNKKGQKIGGVHELEDIRLRCVMCDGCWIWKGALSTRKNEGGRPSVSIVVDGKRQSMQGRRAALLMAGVKLKPGYVVVANKKCQDPLCVNPAHAEAISSSEHRTRIALASSWKTHKDKVIRGRKRREALAKLSPDQVAEIKARPTERSDALAAEFGVSRNAINDIRSGRSWRDIGGPATVANASVFAWRPAA